MMNNIKGSENEYTFDTCVGIKICKNPNVGNMLGCRVNFENSNIHLNSQTVFEATNLGHDIDHISEQIQKIIGVNVIRGHITDDMKYDAINLESIYPMLHAGDSQILAYAKAIGTTLITCDKDLGDAAKSCGVEVINPDLLHCTMLVKKATKTKVQEIVRKAMTKPAIAKQKIESCSLKPNKKIIWNTFV